MTGSEWFSMAYHIVSDMAPDFGATKLVVDQTKVRSGP
jgi:hypothetical protein